MAEVKCPICDREIKAKEAEIWMKRWGEEEWADSTLRQCLISQFEYLTVRSEKLEVVEELCEKQAKYIQELERQLELLQKTLELVEKLRPPKILIPEGGEMVG